MSGIRDLDLFSAIGSGSLLSGLGGGKSGSAASASGATSVGTGPPGAKGSEAVAAEAGSAPEGSARVDGSGAAAVVPGSSWSCTALAALMISTTLFSK
jgi:hypothetical protein